MEKYNLLIALIGSGGLGALIATIANVIQNRRKSVTEQKGSAIEQTKETVSLVDELLQKQLKWMSERMDSNDNVRKQEFAELRTVFSKRFDAMENENKSHNNLLHDIVEFLNGEFQEFENKKKIRRK
jgi:hypothetical protein